MNNQSFHWLLRVATILVLSCLIRVPAAYSQSSDSLSTVTVYPGDTDNSGAVNELDIIPLGLYWEVEGPARDSSSIDWKPQGVKPWDTLPACFADANGDGVVNELDIFPVALNWGKTHPVGRLAPTKGIGTPVVINRKQILRNLIELRRRLKVSGNLFAFPFLEPLIQGLGNSQESEISNPFPNPFNGAANIKLRLSVGSECRIDFYDLTGRRVKRLFRGYMGPGEHSVTWDGRDDRGHRAPSGLYFIRVDTGLKLLTRKVIVTK